ncbi:cytochrome P450 family protein [Rhizohabitans arisaemae]|uniref:cytochrome P450 family protein n=1 Tax=Rhizohabitans arisaemae TaxID=2720610 RepID=UPI0024B1518D|nr:cytochrome P450 [Rhizohabitans arisaemae]
MIQEFESVDPGFNADPYPAYAALRKSDPVCPVTLADGLYARLVTRYEDARSVLADPRFGKDPRLAPADWREAGRGRPLEDRSGLGTHLLTVDPPEHTRLRTLTSSFFTRRRVEALRPLVENTVDTLIGGFAARGHADLIAEFAVPLQATVISEILGIPAADRADFQRWSDDVVLSRAGRESRRPEALRNLLGCISALVAAKRRSPGEDVVSVLAGSSGGADGLSEQELLAAVFLLLVAGYETTVHLVGNGVLALLDHPGQLARLRAEPESIGGAVEEILRYDGPVETATWRFPVEPVEVGGTLLAPGTPVLVSLAAADRDGDRFADPDRFDVGREDASAHLAFGHGAHYCSGAALARMEGRIALGALIGRLPGLALAVPRSELLWRRSLTIRGVQALPVDFGPEKI